jgi:hypothetical protein
MTLAARLRDWLWIPVASWLEPDGTRITVPAHWLGALVPWRRRADGPAWGPTP